MSTKTGRLIVEWIIIAAFVAGLVLSILQLRGDPSASFGIFMCSAGLAASIGALVVTYRASEKDL
jgi:hypothetical protein